jgi:NadR type nicotinamide-nucleotide adenylyltransferase
VNVLRIAITGPECSGKTTLAKELARRFQTVYVPEFARSYLETKTGPYTLSDLEQILIGQLEAEKEAMGNANQFLFCDTDPLVIKIWAEERFGTCPPAIQQAFETHLYDRILLCAPDIPWEPDPLRENPQDREWLYQRYRDTLLAHNHPFVEVTGPLEKRLSFTEKLLADS